MAAAQGHVQNGDFAPSMTSAPHPWLSIVGIGEDGRAGLTPRALALLDRATFIFGGARHLALAAPLHAATMTWPSPLADAIPLILARRGETVCILASGDPFFYGVGSLVAAHVPPEEMICVPSPSSFSLAAARLGWAQHTCRLVSLHGRALERLIPELQPRAKILALAWDETTPPRIADMLVSRGLGRSTMWVMEALGGARERITRATASDFQTHDVDPLNLIALDIAADAQSRILPIGSGLADSWFEHDGQLTKKHVRALTLSALTPHRGDLLLDIGAGAGSIAIEWLLLDPANRAIAVERDGERAQRITRNAVSLGVPQLEIIVGEAPQALALLPQPDAIFIGGGADAPGLLDKAYAALATGGRLVVNAVTLATQGALMQRYQHQGGELISIDIAHAGPLGGTHGFTPARPIMQWVVRKAS
jgi:precorrin-6B C5,15-methyltransferase / cobalt-precorrin-6B C5,C15-methyltransferase